MRHWIKWILLAVVKPCLMLWIIMEGLPGVCRAIGSSVATVVKAFR